MSFWWENYPWRMIQTNLREIDMDDIYAESYAEQLADFGATIVTLNAAGIIASYETKLDFQPRSPYLHGDNLQEIIDACHKKGIKVIARTDFSKVRYEIYEKHPEWAYRKASGEIVNYNGDVHVCPNGGYQQEKVYEILEEVLSTHSFDGVFCNMSGFLVMDYSGAYHGPCHCESCKKKFKEQYGLDIPVKDDPKHPDYSKYVAFKMECSRVLREKIISVIKGIREDIAINGLDYIRTESSTEIGRPKWQYSASSNARQTAGPLRKRPSDNASVDFLGFRYRYTSVSSAQMALRQWQNLANANSTSLYIMGRLDNHLDQTSLLPTKKVFDFHKKHEVLLQGLTSGAKVAIIHKGILALNDPEVYGWIRALTESHIPFDEVKLTEIIDWSVLTRWDVIILGDARNSTPEQAAQFDAYVREGGKLIATGHTGIQGDNQQLLSALGVTSIVKKDTALMSSIFEINTTDEKFFPRSALAHYIAPGGHFVTAEFNENVKTYLRLIPEHPFGPPEKCYYTTISKQPGISVHEYGRGLGIYIPWLVGSFYFNEGYKNTLDVMQDVLYEFCGLPNIAPQLSPMVELVLCEDNKHTVIHLINGSGVFGNSYFEPLPIHNISIQIPLINSVTISALNGGKVNSSEQDGLLKINLDTLVDYEAIVLVKIEEEYK